jgi:DNA-binding NarL/FixJ family response regulator
MATNFEQIPLEEVKKLTGIGKNGLPVAKNLLIKVLLADDSEVVLRAIRGFLDQDPEIKVVAEAADFSQTVQMANDLKPEIIVMDLHMRNSVTTLADAMLHLNGCGAQVLAMSFSNDDDAKALAKHSGALALLDKMTLIDELIPTIKMFASAAKSPAV